jgi:hypothetical protein
VPPFGLLIDPQVLRLIVDPEAEADDVIRQDVIFPRNDFPHVAPAAAPEARGAGLVPQFGSGVVDNNALSHGRS